MRLLVGDRLAQQRRQASPRGTAAPNSSSSPLWLPQANGLRCGQSVGSSYACGLHSLAVHYVQPIEIAQFGI